MLCRYASQIEQKAKYSVWKAADIRKALAEGRKPAPGPPVSYQDFGVNELELETEVCYALHFSLRIAASRKGLL